MVIPAAKPTVTQEHDVSQDSPRRAPNGASTGTRFVCPRCNASLWINYDELECLHCGYVDYEYTPSTNGNGNGKKSIISTATRYVLRYVGDFPTLSDTVAQVHVQRVRNFVIYGVKCPFCSKPMIQSSLSGNRRGVREGRYRCDVGHRVSLTPDKDGGMGWSPLP